MKIEWLNDDCTEAYVIKGWFRKRRAHVRWQQIKPFDYCGWVYLPSERRVVGDVVVDTLNAQRERSRKEQDWQPIRALPPARLVERKTGGAE